MNEEFERVGSGRGARAADSALDALLAEAAAEERGRSLPRADRFLEELRARIESAEPAAAAGAARPRAAAMGWSAAALALLACLALFFSSPAGKPTGAPDSAPVASSESAGLEAASIPAEEISLLIDLAEVFEGSGVPAEDLEGIDGEEVELLEDLELLEDALELLENS
ncbi:MAG: hypothetical protein L0Z55_09980 [Planctomycetes bacterium]|nr:hypothetical protein [Planctomycetota bacterium]